MKKWNILHRQEPSRNDLMESMSISKEIGQILLNRGIESQDQVEMFTDPSLKYLRDPFLLKDMDKAVERIRQAISRKEKIWIFGDYDVDGVSSTSIMVLYFKSIGYPVDYYIPNRLEEGYGLNIEAIDHIGSQDGRLIITVDCGITSVKEVEYARGLGIDVIITDHHECQENLPAACAVVDPKREDCSYPFDGICGCGVAFKLIHALSGNEDFYKNINRYLEIVSLATICDIMPILDENRIIVKNGMEILGQGNNIGMKALLEVCGLDGTKIKSSHLGFAIGPRINASGRLGFSKLGVDLFTSDNLQEARNLALMMDTKNTERQEVEARIHMEVEDIISKDPSYRDDKVLVVSGEDWHHGIIGIVASKVTEKYYKPCILLCEEGDIAVGSARSIKGFDIFSALYECRDYMTKFGGHQQAAGMSMEVAKIGLLREKINQIANYELDQEDLVEVIRVEYEINQSSLNLDLVENLHLLEPFGIKNPTPYFMLRKCLLKRLITIGRDKNHLKMVVEKDMEFDVIGFNMAHLGTDYQEGDLVDLVFQVDSNTFNNKTSLQLLLKDMRLSKPKSLYPGPYYGEIIDMMIPDKCRANKSDILSDRKDFASLENRADLNRIDDIFRLKFESEDFEGEKAINNQSLDFGESNLMLVNTINGYFRAMSDKNLYYDQKIDLICPRNIDKMALKVYNKIIVYDYLDNYEQYKNLLENIGDSDLLINYDKSDFEYLKNKFRMLEFDRKEFVVVYKKLMGINMGKIKYSQLIEVTGVNPVKLDLILRVLASENLMRYEADFERDSIDVEILPRPDIKLDLEKNKIVEYIGEDYNKFVKTYNL